MSCDLKWAVVTNFCDIYSENIQYSRLMWDKTFQIGGKRHL